MNSVTDGRVPWAWHQCPRRFASAGPSAHAIPTGVAVLHYFLLPNINSNCTLNVSYFQKSSNTVIGKCRLCFVRLK